MILIVDHYKEAGFTKNIPVDGKYIAHGEQKKNYFNGLLPYFENCCSINFFAYAAVFGDF